VPPTARWSPSPDGSPAGSLSWERWVHAPRQQRARATFERVLDAGARLLAERGYDGFSIVEVCRRAGVAPGTLYDRVDSKELLFLALHDRELERLSAGPIAALRDHGAWARLNTSDLVREVVALLGRHYAAEAALLRVFILRAAVDPRVRDEGAVAAARLEEAAVSLLLTRQRDYPNPDPGRAVRTAYRIVADSLSWRTAFGADFHPSGTETDAEWTARLQEVACNYLLSPGKA
jgi:AcrR family transcriptional regulator